MASEDWIKEEKTTQRADGKWEVTMKICNPTDHDIESVLVTEHPWAGPKIGEQPQSKFIKLAKGECKPLTFGPYDKKPTNTYTDVYEKVGLELKWRAGTVTALAALVLPPRENGQTVALLHGFLHHPWRLAMTDGRTRRFAIAKVTGLPKGWRAKVSQPAGGARLDGSSKHHPFSVTLTTARPVPVGTAFTVVAVMHPVGSPKDAFHTQYLSFPVVKDKSSVPSTKVRRPRRGSEGAIPLDVAAQAFGLSAASLRAGAKR